MKKITFVIATYNEEENVENLVNELNDKVISKKSYSFEILFIDNDSKDNTASILKKLASQNKSIKIILNQRNFGPFRSPMHALQQVYSDAAITMPADGEFPVEKSLELIEKWENGSDVVLLRRKNSNKNYLMSKFRNLFYKILNAVSDIKLPEKTPGIGIFDKKVISEIRKRYDPLPYTRGLVAELGYKISYIDFNEELRKRGKSSYNFNTLLNFALIGFIKHGKPLRLFMISGVFLGMLSFLTALFFLFYKILYWDTFEVGMAPLILGVFLLGSFQIFMLGFIGEYLLAILEYNKKIPLVIEKERINFD